ncbi:NUDIX hydrolase [Aminobacter carboxidus]|uniref:NUDIX hydrolase n=1 Tax=Aminobacter carboxidus TaxID=376165 RepID=A0ABR9GQP5_9HYPH|nr:NUDIX hydrolase [Aminobacter carboxidus]MBE1206000.1 NUDIX hydrolase [Aminobacter carboxidus]
MNKRKKRAIRSAIKGDPASQVAALPYRLAADGSMRVMLITSRGTRRFVVPKGWPMKKKSPAAAAACEARQEAGVVGQMARVPIGTFRYWKRLPVGFVPVIVRVFPMAVETVLDSWKEEDERGRKWLRPEDAATLVDEPALASLVRRMPDLIGRGQLGEPSGHASG